MNEAKLHKLFIRVNSDCIAIENSSFNAFNISPVINKEVGSEII